MVNKFESFEWVFSDRTSTPLNNKLNNVPDSKIEEVIGKRPVSIGNASTDPMAFSNYMHELDEWNKKYNKFFELVNGLEYTNSSLDKLKVDLEDWCIKNPGIFLLTKDADKYSLSKNPIDVLDNLKKELNIPEDINSIDDDMSWFIKNATINKLDSTFPTAVVDIDGNIIKFISIPNNLTLISDILEDHMDKIQPHDLLSFTNANMDAKTRDVLNNWNNNHTTSSELDEKDRELKLFIESLLFLNEIQQIKEYPDTSSMSRLIKSFDVLD